MQNVRRTHGYLWVVLCISRLEGDKLQIQGAPQVDRGDNVPASQQL